MQFCNNFFCYIVAKTIRPTRPRLDGRIVGGEDALIQEYPYQILLEYYGSHRCGGSIISKNVILTAAHCIDYLSPSSLTIRAGSTVNGQGGVVVNVKKLEVHENYYNLDYDVGLMFVSTIFDPPRNFDMLNPLFFIVGKRFGIQ